MGFPVRGLPFLAAALLFPVSAEPQVQRAPDNVQEPPEIFRPYVVNPTDGSLSTLEEKTTKEDRRSSVYGYIRLDTPVPAFSYGTPLVLAYRVEMRHKDFDKDLARGAKEPLYGIEVLAPHPGWTDYTATPDRRYATGRFAPVHDEAYGPRKSGINPKKADRASQTYVFWPTAVLPPGEYAVTAATGGLFPCAGCGGGGYPFRIVSAPAASSPPVPRAAPERPPTASVAPQRPEGTAEVAIESTPSNAEVTVDGELVGTTPLRYPLAAGTRQITVSRKGYRPWTRQLKITAGVPTRLLAELEPSGH